MEKSELLNIIRNPSLLQKTKGKLPFDKLKNQYPYFQSIHILAFLDAQFHEGVFNNPLLFKTALYSGDRSRLFHRSQSQEKTMTYPSELLMGEIPVYDIEKEFQKSGSPAATKKKEDKDIIDRFLEQQPRIQKPRAEFFNPVNKAAESLQESDEFATETLAKIYIKQKNYKKAIRIYQKLSLQFPEKSDYFAGLIKSLENKLNE